MAKSRPRTRPARPDVSAPCPCGREATYADCCGRLHAGTATAATAEELMRSRYSAFAVGDAAYLTRTWHPDTRPPRVGTAPRTVWTGLEITSTTGGTPFHNEGTVAFRARYREGAAEGELREDSRFVRHGGAWVYLDGSHY
ncbi:YchJ family protein [Nocardiopsis sp. LOL_012]|uniref:YchJ family protein n=1 Tax=Nocardiopsis sp. LOL_012 TaxID=3345409 RepID=UPI003A88F9BA